MMTVVIATRIGVRDSETNLLVAKNIHFLCDLLTRFCFSGSSCSVTEAGLYSMLFSYSNLLTVFFGPVGGVFTDYMIRKAYRSKAKRVEGETDRYI